MKIMYKSILGGAAISLGTLLSVKVGHPYLSPLIFSVGILLVIGFQLELITKTIPVEMKLYKSLQVLGINLLTAFICGTLVHGYTVPTVNTSFKASILGGIIIAVVSLVNVKKIHNRTIITLILMFSFVWLKLPHMVVYAFNTGVSFEYWEFLPRVILGNVVGGVFVGAIFKFGKVVRK